MPPTPRASAQPRAGPADARGARSTEAVLDGTASYSVDTLLGRRGEPALDLAARRLVEELAGAGCTRCAAAGLGARRPCLRPGRVVSHGGAWARRADVCMRSMCLRLHSLQRWKRRELLDCVTRPVFEHGPCQPCSVTCRAACFTRTSSARVLVFIACPRLPFITVLRHCAGEHCPPCMHAAWLARPTMLHTGARLPPGKCALRVECFQLAVARARRPLLLCLGLREHSLAAVRGLVEAVLAHPVW